MQRNLGSSLVLPLYFELFIHPLARLLSDEQFIGVVKNGVPRLRDHTFWLPLAAGRVPAT